jgi:hypothetical protein
VVAGVGLEDVRLLFEGVSSGAFVVSRPSMVGALSVIVSNMLSVAQGLKGAVRRRGISYVRSDVAP